MQMKCPRRAAASPVPNLTEEQRAALQMLAGSHRGYSLTTVAARGFSFEMLEELVRTGLLSTSRNAIGLGKFKVAFLRITEKGRKAIAE
jgi:hypothetical protein